MKHLFESPMHVIDCRLEIAECVKRCLRQGSLVISAYFVLATCKVTRASEHCDRHNQELPMQLTPYATHSFIS